MVTLAALVACAGCSRAELIAGVSDSTYVRAMSALRRLPAAPTMGQAARDRVRDSILRGYGMNAEQLEAATLSLADDPVRAAAIFRAIESRTPDPVADPPIRRGAKKDSVTR
jgi:hypothetical protein